ncbi:MAG: 16S rRNA (guanine(966)-N(2))-methyltransferase RsmD [Oscillospiraceae bacterium]
MRIITGTARGRKIKEPAGWDIRPTTDRVKEAVFNIIQFDIEGRRVLDMFAGTGQLGIEALSRGAASAVFVDRDQTAVKLVRENLKSTELEANASVINGDGIEYLKRGGKFDLVFMDPPYDTDLLDRSILVANEFDILKDNGIIVCESKAEKPMPELLAPYRKLREYRYGKIKITTYSKGAE